MLTGGEISLSSWCSVSSHDGSWTLSVLASPYGFGRGPEAARWAAWASASLGLLGALVPPSRQRVPPSRQRVPSSQQGIPPSRQGIPPCFVASLAASPWLCVPVSHTAPAPASFPRSPESSRVHPASRRSPAGSVLHSPRTPRVQRLGQVVPSGLASHLCLQHRARGHPVADVPPSQTSQQAEAFVNTEDP